MSTEYRYGFSTSVEQEVIEKGLNEEIIRLISSKKQEPPFILDFRLRAFAVWKKMKEPTWAQVSYPPIDYQAFRYFSAPKKRSKIGSLTEADPEVLKTFQKLGIPVHEQHRLANVAVDMVFDSISIGTTLKEKLHKEGVIFCSISEAIQRYPALVEQYLGSVVPIGDNFFAALNSAVFTDGSFVYIPKGVHCPMELSTYFRINDQEAGQFERTLIITEDDGYVSYLEGCTAPSYSQYQLHAAVVELIAHHRATIKYATVQNWYAGDNGTGGVYNFVTKRGKCAGISSKILWTQVEVGASITWKYPSCILQGDHSIGSFFSVAITNGSMQADTGTKMIHIGNHTKSTIISKGIAADHSSNSYRGMVVIGPSSQGARNYTQCDSMLIGNACSANTFPTMSIQNPASQIEHEASTSKMNEEQLFFLQTRGFSFEEAVRLIVTSFCQQVLSTLPLEFAQEAEQLLSLKLEKSVG